MHIGNVDMIIPFRFTFRELWIKDHHNNILLHSNKLHILLKNYRITNRTIQLSKIALNNGFIAINKYPGEDFTNVQLLMENLSGTEEQETAQKPLSIMLHSLQLKESRFIFHDYNTPSSGNGVDFQHLDFEGINANISNISIIETNIQCDIISFSCYEKSGFNIQKLRSRVSITPQSIKLAHTSITTDHSKLLMTISFLFSSFDSFSQFESRVFMNYNFNYSKINSIDIGYFVPAFYQTNNILTLNGKISGTLNNLKANDLLLQSTGMSVFEGSLSLKGLPDIKNTYASLDINRFYTNANEIGTIQIRDQSNGFIAINPPDILNRLGEIGIKGYFNGTYNDFSTEVLFSTSLGNAFANLAMTPTDDGVAYTGNVSLSHFNAGQFADVTDLGIVSMKAFVKGTANKNDILIDINGLLDSIEYKQYIYNNVKITGEVFNKRFGGNLHISDKNIDFDFDGIIDFNQEIPQYDFEASITNARPHNLNLINDSLGGTLNTTVTFNAQGDKLDNFAGILTMGESSYKTADRDYRINYLDMSAFSSPENNRKLVTIRSDFISGDIHGYFNYSDLLPSFKNLAYLYLPAFSQAIGFSNDTLSTENNNEFNFSLKLTDISGLIQYLTGNNISSENFQINGTYLTHQQNIKIWASADKLTINDIPCSDLYFQSHTKVDALYLEGGCSEIKLSDTLDVFTPYIESYVRNDHISTLTTWKNSPSQNFNDGSLRYSLSLEEYPVIGLRINKGQINILDSVWHIQPGSKIELDDKTLSVTGFNFYKGTQNITIEGKASSSLKDNLEVSLQNIDMSIIDFITAPANIDFDGIISGNISLKNILESPRIMANIDIDNFAINKEKIGDATISSIWNEERKGMNIDAAFIYTGNIGAKEVLIVDGYIYPGKEQKNNFDMNFKLDNFKIHTINNFISSLSSDFRGLAQGNLQLRGKFDAPELTGELKVIAKNMLIDYLNTRYSFAHTIIFTKEAISFSNLQLNDNNKSNGKETHSALVSGSIYHQGFKKFRLDIKINAKNFTFLNTNGNQDPYYYGKAVATGTVEITGPVEDIFIKIIAKTEKNTNLSIPLNTTSEVSQHNFITFVDTSKESVTSATAVVPQQRSVLRLTMDLKVTPDADVQLIFDPLVGDIIKGNGSGDLNMRIDSRGEFELFGTYVINEGEYLFTLENLINKKFVVTQGDKIVWTGDPYDAEVDITALYGVTTSLNPISLEDLGSKKEKVNCVIKLTGNLFNPTITFDVDFPELQEFEREKYKAAIRPNLSYQFLSLLVAHSFVSTQNEMFVENSSVPTSTLVSSGTELLAQQLSIWLSNISNNFDVDLDYQAGTGISDEQMKAALKTQLFDDRLTLEGGIGVTGRNYTKNVSNASNIVGDFVVEYKLTEEGQVNVKAFNKYNERDILDAGAPYTQGVGIFYRREFDTLKELFTGKSKKDTLQ